MSVDHGLLAEVAEALDQATDPADARARVARLRQRHTGTDLSLTVDVEPYDASAAYHVSIHDRGGPAWSLAKAPSGGLPWPLRGVVRSTERDLLRVGERVLQVDEAIACLDHVWSDERLTERLVAATLVQQAIEERSLTLDARELQAAVDAFRRAKGLHTTETTRTWLERQGLALAGLVELARGSALVARLRAQVVAEASAKEVANLAERLVNVHVAWTEPADRDTAAAFATDPATVIAAARNGRNTGIARWRAEDVPELFATLLDAPVDEVVRIADGRIHAVVLARTRAISEDPDTQRRLEQLIFEQWLAARRAQVQVEWLWGVNAVLQPALANG